LKATRRNLAHWELGGRIYYVTFSTCDRFVIPEPQRSIVFDALQHWNDSRIRLHQAVVMPDHVHALVEPINNHDLSTVLHSIKSFAANEINQALSRNGHLWQPESFDRIVRDPEDYLQKWEYIRNNPVKGGLSREPEQYPWLYDDAVVKQCSLEGCPPTWVPNVLAHDVEKWAKWILEQAREKIAHLYPPGKDGRPVVGYLWARTAPCSNPSCRGEIPLLRSLLVCNKKDKTVALTMEVVGGQPSRLQEKGNRQDACSPTDPMEVARGHGIFMVNGSKCRLALLTDRAERRGLGADQNPPLIDALHRSMLLWKEEKRRELVSYLAERGLLKDGPFWKLGQALFEVLPRDLEDWKLVNTLLGERQTLRAEGKREAFRDAQRELHFDRKT